MHIGLHYADINTSYIHNNEKWKATNLYELKKIILNSSKIAIFHIFSRMLSIKFAFSTNGLETVNIFQM